MFIKKHTIIINEKRNEENNSNKEERNRVSMASNIVQIIFFERENARIGFPILLLLLVMVCYTYIYVNIQ